MGLISKKGYIWPEPISVKVTGRGFLTTLTAKLDKAAEDVTATDEVRAFLQEKSRRMS